MGSFDLGTWMSNVLENPDAPIAPTPEQKRQAPHLRPKTTRTVNVKMLERVVKWLEKARPDIPDAMDFSGMDENEICDMPVGEGTTFGAIARALYALEYTKTVPTRMEEMISIAGFHADNCRYLSGLDFAGGDYALTYLLTRLRGTLVRAV